MKSVTVLSFVIISLCSFTNFQERKADVNKGRELFESKCAKCHGADGTKGKWGAKNLQISTLSDSDMRTIITNGKRIMPAWGKHLTDDEMVSVIDYVKTLRK
jgi:cytochrome c6